MALSVLTFIANLFTYAISGLFSLIVQFFNVILGSLSSFVLQIVLNWVTAVNTWGIYAPIATVVSMFLFMAGTYMILIGARMVSDLD